MPGTGLLRHGNGPLRFGLGLLQFFLQGSQLGFIFGLLLLTCLGQLIAGLLHGCLQAFLITGSLTHGLFVLAAGLFLFADAFTDGPLLFPFLLAQHHQCHGPAKLLQTGIPVRRGYPCVTEGLPVQVHQREGIFDLLLQLAQIVRLDSGQRAVRLAVESIDDKGHGRLAPVFFHVVTFRGRALFDHGLGPCPGFLVFLACLRKAEMLRQIIEDGL